MKSTIFLSLIFSRLLAMDPYEFHQQQQKNYIRNLTDKERLELDRYYEKRKKAALPYDSNRSAKEIDIFREAPPPAW